MQGKKQIALLRANRVVWAGSLLIWAISEYLVVYFQIIDHLYNASTVQFYYRPIAMTLPLVVGFGIFRRLEKSFAFPDSVNVEQLSWGFGFVTLIFYLCLAATIMEFVVRFSPK
jgi:hypothetical protein